MAEKTLIVDLGDDVSVAVVVEQTGPQFVADEDIVAKFDVISTSIERVSSNILQAEKRAGLSKATVELGFSLAIEERRLVALFGKGKAEASVAVTLEWTASEGEDAG